LCSSSTQPASDIYEDEGILMITPRATTPELTQRGIQHILRTAGLDSSQGPTAAKYILETVKPQRIGIIPDKQQYGEGLARSGQDGLKILFGNMVLFFSSTDVDNLVSELFSSVVLYKSDLLEYSEIYEEIRLMLLKPRATGLKTQ
ncbi:leucine ABC transporter subunit substrate-binding protein LivK, partial [Enterobacter intestinihominis]